MTFSNPVIMALLVGSVSSLQMLGGTGYNSANALSSSATGYGCNVCIRNGWVYAVPDSQTWYTVITDVAEAYAGECCDTIANCPNAYDAGAPNSVKAGWKASTVTFSNVDMAVHACPFKAHKCKNP
jgi:hypothetical protein